MTSTATEVAAEPKYRMQVSRLTIDKLGIKLYDRVTDRAIRLPSSSADQASTSSADQRHGYSPVNIMNRRTADSLGSTVDTASARDLICVDHPVSIASHTASSGCRCRTDDGTKANADTSREAPSATSHPLK